MHLIDTKTRRLIAVPCPPERYAILSHTWDSEEITFQDIMSGQPLETRPGYPKFDGAIKLAAIHGYKLVWIDNCCIDKSSSAELSEAINSMFQWYRQASVCYVYLSDVVAGPSHHQHTCDEETDEEVISNFTRPECPREQLSQCRWLRRCWTLQELIAPAEVEFYSGEWWFIGEKHAPDWLDVLVEETRISEAALTSTDGYKLASVAQKMSWAADRNATRAEDIAYSLFGLFEVNMAPLYGEGSQSAFRRLQEEIIRKGVDDSILAWDPTTPLPTSFGGSQSALAPSPRCFRDKGHIVYGLSDTVIHMDPLSVTQWGLSLSVPIRLSVDGDVIAILSCRSTNNMARLIGIKLIPTLFTAHATTTAHLPHIVDFFKRNYLADVLHLGDYGADGDLRHRITIVPEDGILARRERSLKLPPHLRRTRLSRLPSGFQVTAIHSEGGWDQISGQIYATMGTDVATTDSSHHYQPRCQLFLISDLRGDSNHDQDDTKYIVKLIAQCDDREDTINISIHEGCLASFRYQWYSSMHSPPGPRPYDPTDQSACRFSYSPDSNWKTQAASISTRAVASTGSRLRAVVQPESGFEELGLMLSIDEYFEVDAPGTIRIGKQ